MVWFATFNGRCMAFAMNNLFSETF